MSSYQQAGIPTDLKKKIARLGINMLLKMVSARAGRERSGPAWGRTACGEVAEMLVLVGCQGWGGGEQSSKPPR